MELPRPRRRKCEQRRRWWCVRNHPRVGGGLG